MAIAGYMNASVRHSASLLIPRLIGSNQVKTYSNDAARDAAIPTPVDGYVVWNSSRNCCQVYNKQMAVWVGHDPVSIPVFVDATDLFHDVMPSAVRGCLFNGKFFSCEESAYTDGRRVYAAATTDDILMEAGCSQGIFVNRTVSGNTALARSADGVAAFSDVLAPAGLDVNSLGSSLIDCGGGKLFYVTYNNRIYYSVNGGLNWGNNSPAFDDGDPLITHAAGAISHFHGGFYDSTYGRLYVFTGDTNAGCSILICEDIADLVANPATWSARWGLDDAGRSTLDENYVLGHGVQRYRVIQMVIAGDWIYTGADGGSYEFGGFQVYRIHRQTLKEENVYCWPVQDAPATYTAPGLAVGVPWTFSVTADGVVLFSAVSEYVTSAYRAACDKYNRIYAILPDGRQAVEVHRSIRADWESPSGISNTYNIAPVGHLLYVTGKNYNHGMVAVCGTRPQVQQYLGAANNAYFSIDAKSGVYVRGDTAGRAALNWIPNGRALSNVTGWTAYSSTVDRETTVVDHGEVASIKVTPTAAGGHARYTLDAARLNSIRGNLVTLTARIKFPAAQNNSQDPKLHLRIGASVYRHVAFTASHFDDGWHEAKVTAYVPTNCTSMSLRLYANYVNYAEGMDPIYFSDVRLSIGSLSIPRCSPPIVSVA